MLTARALARWTPAGILLVLVLSACGASHDQIPDPYSADFEQAMETATSGFERAVLDDGLITDAEYAEAQARLVQCVADRGYLLEVDGSDYTLSGFETWAEGDTASEIQDECARGTTQVLEPLYVAITTNPEKEDQATLIAACLVEHRLVPEDFTADDFAASFGDEDPVYDLQDPQVNECLNNPKGT